jgi:valyl-tRNA synthetase
VELVGAKAEILRGCERDIKETIKARSLVFETKADLEEKIVALNPVKSKIGPMFKANGKEVIDTIKAAKPESFGELIVKGKASITLKDGTVVEVTPDIVEVQRSMALHGQLVQTLQVGEVLVVVQP